MTSEHWQSGRKASKHEAWINFQIRTNILRMSQEVVKYIHDVWKKSTMY